MVFDNANQNRKLLEVKILEASNLGDTYEGGKYLGVTSLPQIELYS